MLGPSQHFLMSCQLPWEPEIWVLFALVPGHCILVTFLFILSKLKHNTAFLSQKCCFRLHLNSRLADLSQKILEFKCVYGHTDGQTLDQCYTMSSPSEPVSGLVSGHNAHLKIHLMLKR